MHRDGKLTVHMFKGASSTEAKMLMEQIRGVQMSDFLKKSDILECLRNEKDNNIIDTFESVECGI